LPTKNFEHDNRISARLQNHLDPELNKRLGELRAQELYRELRRVDSPQAPHIEISGRTFLNFSSNDYLGLANEPAVKNAAIEAIQRFGAGAGASRLICGSLAPFHELEERLAAFKKTEAALTFATGYAAAIGAVTTLLGKDDIVLIDKLVHASLIDAAKLSDSKLRVFAHNDLNDLEDKLKWATAQRAQNSSRHVLIITESVFSMDGDLAPLQEIVELKERFNAWLMIDEAHATGVFGKTGRGLADQLGVNDRIEIQMGTLGKALGASGGYIAGSRTLIDYLINRARSFVFSTAPVPASAAAAAAALEIVNSVDGAARRKILWANAARLKTQLALKSISSAIIPVILGDETKALAAAAALFDRGIYVPAIRYPTVRRGAARLRVTITAAHNEQDISELAPAWNATQRGLENS